MGLDLNTVLTANGLDPADCRLLRHQDTRIRSGPSLYSAWHSDPRQVERYQESQSIGNRAKLRHAAFWLSFVGAPGNRTMFIGAYAARWLGVLSADRHVPLLNFVDRAGEADAYELTPTSHMADLAGRLFIDWGPGFRSWIQRPDRQNKPVTELLSGRDEPPFPGYSALILNLSEIGILPLAWETALGSVRGVYVLTCPRTKEQYVGKAVGAGGFLGRWRAYFQDNHGGNVGLKGRNPSDYQVAILEVAGSLASEDEIDAMESRWKRKLQSREMGLNRN